MQSATVDFVDLPGLAPTKVEAGALGDLLDRVLDVEHLSLDCFDTIVWRHVAEPIDVFYAAAARTSFRALGISASARVAAEQFARDLQRLRFGRTEVDLADIYREACPDGLTEEQINALAEDELVAEMEFCFAFPAAVRLLRAAAKRRIPVTVVSDTYFDEDCLQRLLHHVLPPDVRQTIGRIVCSSRYRRSKVQGLLELAYPPGPSERARILHVGDNLEADFQAARRAGMQAVHLVQESRTAVARHGMRSAALSLLDPTVRSERPIVCPYRGVLALRPESIDGDTEDIGGSVAGSILHAFASWLTIERRRLLERNPRTKFFFLLRDGHLPYLVYRALEPASDSYAVRISRFTAYAASFRSVEDVDRLLARFAAVERFDAVARQLLLPRKIARTLIARARNDSDPQAAFIDAVRTPEIIERIVKASAQFRERMRRYLERKTGMQPGDTVVFVDLGYSGTAQRVLTDVFADEFRVRIIGRYLLMLGKADENRSGFIDGSRYDERVLHTLVPYVSLLENLCTEDAGSVEDYTEAGDAMLAESMLASRQRDFVVRAQSRFVAFAREAEEFFASCPRRPGVEWLRDAALGEFARMVFFPDQGELQALESFELDLNVGTRDRLALFDHDIGLEELRRRGINIVERHSAMRLHYPAELRFAGLELSMALLSQHRFGLDLPIASWNLRREQMQLLIVSGDRATEETLLASATHDGYFSCLIPLGSTDCSYGLLLGKSYGWLQFHSAEVVPVAELMGSRESRHRSDVRSALVLDGIREHAEGLWECTEPSSLAMIPAGVHASVVPCALRFVYRPIVRRR